MIFLVGVWCSWIRHNLFFFLVLFHQNLFWSISWFYWQIFSQCNMHIPQSGHQCCKSWLVAHLVPFHYWNCKILGRNSHRVLIFDLEYSIVVILDFVNVILIQEEVTFRDHSGYGLSQWETTLQYNISHWLSPYLERSKEFRTSFLCIDWRQQSDVY